MTITESGTPQAYRLYDRHGATIDVQHRHDACIVLNASNVILRGFTLRGAGATTSTQTRPMGAIQIDAGHNIVIEQCDICDWGRLNSTTSFGRDCDSAIVSRSPTLKRLIIQRCRAGD